VSFINGGRCRDIDISNLPLAGDDNIVLNSTQRKDPFQSLTNLPRKELEYGRLRGTLRTYHHITEIKFFVLQYRRKNVSLSTRRMIRNWKHRLHYFTDDASEEDACDRSEH